jgi:hypothetical protein
VPINHNEIIEEMEGQIRKCGGAWERAAMQNAVLRFCGGDGGESPAGARRQPDALRAGQSASPILPTPDILSLDK